jgi:hypothetical protein
VSEERSRSNYGVGSIEERLALAAPTWLMRLILAGVARLPPASQVRRRLLKRGFARATEDPPGDEFRAAALLVYEPDVEVRVIGDVAGALGLAETSRGHRGRVEAWEDYTRHMENFHYEIEQMIDLGQRIALRVRMFASGRRSGVETGQTQGCIYYLSTRGMIAREEIYWAWEDALATLEQHE